MTAGLAFFSSSLACGFMLSRFKRHHEEKGCRFRVYKYRFFFFPLCFFLPRVKIPCPIGTLRLVFTTADVKQILFIFMYGFPATIWPLAS